MNLTGGIRIDNNEKKKKEPWRIIVGIIAIAYIVYMWVEKDIMTIYTTMPKEQVAPLIATTIAVSLIKVTAIAGGILLIKGIISKFKNKGTNSYLSNSLLSPRILFIRNGPDAISVIDIR